MDIYKTIASELIDFPTANYSILATGKYGASTTYTHGVIAVTEGERYIIENFSSSIDSVRYAFVTSDEAVSGGDVPLVEGTIVMVINHESSVVVTIPAGCSFLIFNYGGYSSRVYKVGKTTFKTGEPLEEVGITDTIDDSNNLPTSNAILSTKEYTLCPFSPLVGLKVSNGVIVESSTADHIYCKECKKGEIFKVELVWFENTASVNSNRTRFYYCSTMPAVGVPVTTIRDYVQLSAQNTQATVYFMAPEDGYIALWKQRATSNLYTYNGTDYQVDLASLTSYGIDITEGAIKGIISTTNLEILAHSSYNVTSYIDISEYDYVTIPAILTTNPSASYTNRGCSVFYNENKEFVAFAGYIGFVNSGTKMSNTCILKRPTEAKYIRMTYNVTYTPNILYAYKHSIEYFRSIDNLDTVVANVIANDSKNLRAKSIFEFNPDSELFPKMQALSRERYSTEIKPLVFAHISDVHARDAQYPRFIEFANHWKTKGLIDELIDTGDMASNTYLDTYGWRDDIAGVENILAVIGNHDTRATSEEIASASYPVGQNQWQYHSNISLDATKRKDAYNAYLVGPDANSPYINNWGVTQPANAEANGYCYYYKDYTAKNLRLIFLDVMGYNAQQDTWLSELLSDANTLGYHVSIIAHFCGNIMTSLECNYTSLFKLGSDISTITAYNADAPLIAETVNTFQNNGGVFVGYFTGHYHRDMVNVLTNYPKQLAFAVSSGGVTPIRDFIKDTKSKSYDDFQIVSINTSDKTVKLLKIGADIDYYMRKKSTLCVGYTLVKDDGTEPIEGETATKVKGIIGEGW